jgi:ABC-type lipoprotein export system ATPase subunit
MILRAEHVSRRVGDQDILNDVSFAVAEGEAVALTGRSGAGKSTLLAIVSTLEHDFTGTVELCGERVDGARERKRSLLRQRALGFVFQIPRLLAGLSVWQNLTAPAWVSGATVDVARAQALLDRVGLAAMRERSVIGLSGGERQRLTLARALLHKPRILFCDEPTGNLDGATSAQIFALLAEVQREDHIALVIATHDAQLSARMNRVLALENGRLA